MPYDQRACLGEPIAIRAHHLFAFQNFLAYRGSLEASLAVWGPKAEAGNFNGYGRAFVVNEAQTWLYLARNRQTRVKITDRADVLCARCEQLGTCNEPAQLDEVAAKMMNVETDREYTVREIIDKISKAIKTIPEDDRNRIGI